MILKGTLPVIELKSGLKSTNITLDVLVLGHLEQNKILCSFHMVNL